MANDEPSSALPLEQYRSYLLLLAGMHLDADVRQHVEPSDMVQQTLLEAHACAERIPRTAEERAAWLRTMLANNLRDARRRLRRQKRDVARERSLDLPLADSSRHLDDWLATHSPSPSAQAMRQEDLLRMADALWALPESQRRAITLHHLQGLSLSETAQRLEKSTAAVAGLLHRGLRQLREQLAP